MPVALNETEARMAPLPRSSPAVASATKLEGASGAVERGSMRTKLAMSNGQSDTARPAGGVVASGATFGAQKLAMSNGQSDTARPADGVDQ